MTAYEINGKEYEVDYDLDNRIIKADIDGDDVEYRYDAFGRRVIRKEGSTKTALIWWANSECAEYKHSSGQLDFVPLSLRQMVASPPRLQKRTRQGRYSVAIQNDLFSHPSRLNAVIARAVDGSKSKLQWYHKNYLDHVYAVSDDDGDLLEHYRYTAFGEVTIYNPTGAQQTTTQINNQILWNTRRRDTVSGYYMYKFRHYSAELGRWLTRDPIEEYGGVNLYAFVNNQPTWYWDYLGLEANKKVEVSKEKLYKEMEKLIDEGGRESYDLSIKDLEKRKEQHPKDRKAGKFYPKPVLNYEFGGRICVKCSQFDSRGKPTHYIIYRTSSITSKKTHVVQLHDMPTCEKGFKTRGVFHNHPNQLNGHTNGGGLSGPDRTVAEKGKKLTFPKDYNKGKEKMVWNTLIGIMKK